MQDFPILCNSGTSVSEAWYAEKMLKDLSPDLSPPAVQVERELFFIHELTQLRDKSYFIPICYYRDSVGGNLSAIRWQAKSTGISDRYYCQQRTKAEDRHRKGL